MTEARLAPFHERHIPSAAKLYAHAYAVPKYGDQTPEAFSQQIIKRHAANPGFLGVLAVTEGSNEVVGFAWGFASPQGRSRLTELVIKKLGPEWIEDTFVLEALGASHTHREVLTNLHHEIMDRALEAGYKRARFRLEIAGTQGLQHSLASAGWEQLQRLSHVLWLGKHL